MCIRDRFGTSQEFRECLQSQKNLLYLTMFFLYPVVWLPLTKLRSLNYFLNQLINFYGDAKFVAHRGQELGLHFKILINSRL